MRAIAAFGDDVAYQRWIVQIHLRALAHRLLLLEHGIDHRLLAFETADACTPATLLHPVPSGIVGIHLVKLPHRAFVRIPGIRATHARRIRWHGADFLRHAGGVLTQRDGVVVGLRHLLPVESGHFRCFSEQRVRFRQDHLAPAFEKPEQPLAIAHRQVCCLL